MLKPNPRLGKKIAFHRKRMKITQAKLATITGIRPKRLGDIEKGKKIRIYTLARIADGLGVSIEELCGEC